MNRQQVINASKGNVSDRPRCVTGNMIAVLPWKRLTVVTKRDVVGRRFFLCWLVLTSSSIRNQLINETFFQKCVVTKGNKQLARLFQNQGQGKGLTRR